MESATPTFDRLRDSLGVPPATKQRVVVRLGGDAIPDLVYTAEQIDLVPGGGLNLDDGKVVIQPVLGSMLWYVTAVDGKQCFDLGRGYSRIDMYPGLDESDDG